ncbi:MAG: response regulator [Planctomycetes bacterium]|nr:response regulator [Planctomycetota bacterium]
MFAPPPTLLITDDDRDFRETLQNVFEPRGYRTVLASDGEEALQVMQKRGVHLALLDMHMPRLTGLETMRRVKQMYLPLPCILISAALDESLIEQARQADAYSVLSKPVTFGDLTHVVNLAFREVYNWPDR